MEQTVSAKAMEDLERKGSLSVNPYIPTHEELEMTDGSTPTLNDGLHENVVAADVPPEGGLTAWLAGECKILSVSRCLF